MVFICNKFVTRHIDNIWDDILYWGHRWQTSDTLFKYISKLKTNFWLKKWGYILRCLILTSKNILYFSRHAFAFFYSKNTEKCVRGQGEMRQASRRSASGVKEKCVEVQEKCFCWLCGIQLGHFSLTPDSLFLDPWHTSPWHGGLIFQS